MNLGDFHTHCNFCHHAEGTLEGHFDLPKKFAIYPENRLLVDEKIEAVLHTIKTTGMAVEINSAGFRKKVTQQYPEDKIIKNLINHNIPIVLGSDAHKPHEVGFAFDTILKKLKDFGLPTLAYIDNGQIKHTQLS